MDIRPTDSYVPEKRGWGHYFKMCALYVGLIVGAYVLYFLANYLIELYQVKATQNYADQMMQEMTKSQKDAYDRAMADTYGGTTPQATLNAYIAAVEKGDYELASKYFIESKRAGELKSFENATPEKVKKFLSSLRQAISQGGKYSVDGKEYEGNSKLLIVLDLYPTGIWKIIEI